MNIFLACLAGLIAGAVGALGLGGGGILMIYLTVFLGIEQLPAQGINLLFFLPTAAVAILYHAKERLIQWKTIWPCIALGVVGSAGGVLLSGLLGGAFLRTVFGGFLVVLGAKELFAKG